MGLATYLDYCACGHVTDASDSTGHTASFTLSNGLMTVWN